jgi:hypothetical protein
LGKVFAVEEDDGIGRSLADLIVCARDARSDDRRERSVAVVVEPVRIGLGEADGSKDERKGSGDGF